MNLITPIVLIIISVITFFTYINPHYQGDNLGGSTLSIKSLQAEDAQYQTALANTTKIAEKRQVLVSKKEALNPDDISKLTQLLPDSVDNIKLVVALNQIAQNHALTLKNIKVDTTPDQTMSSQDNSKYGTIRLSFVVTATYDNFRAFLDNLEKSLSLVEVTDLAVTGNDTGLYDFSVGLKTYWLK